MSEVSSGMKKMFIAQIGLVVCAVIGLVPILGAILAAPGVLVFTIIYIVGLAQTGKEVPACKTALILMIVNFVLSLLALIPFLGKIFSLASTVVSFIVVFLVCSSLASLLRDNGEDSIASTGDLTWKINLACGIASVVCTLLSWIPVLGTAISVLTGLVVGIAKIVAGVIYMIFLKKGSDALA